ncbi:class I SAM-dependent methyltransferase [Streptomyces sp. NPDC052496]|uniref:class I SAM-dependent methyltransferase n=1 Tax=Streptomyces sp. NPDC052496 TaxID=3154951 RepID=UPI003417CB74
MTSASPAAPASDLWHHYGRRRAQTDRSVPERLYWTWGQDSGPGAEILGDLTGARVIDLGSGAGRQAAHLAVHHPVDRVDAVDASATQHAMARDLYGHLAPRLRPLHTDVTAHLREHPAAYDLAYSLFGAACFTDPAVLLPAVADALRPGGQLVIATLAHYLTGQPPAAGIRAAAIPAKLPDGTTTTMFRWVLDAHVWTKALDGAGFTAIAAERLSAAASSPRGADTLLLRAIRTAEPDVRSAPPAA